MRLRPVENAEVETVARWLAQKENYQWLDFGIGNQPVTATLLKVMIRRDSNVYRVFTADSGDAGIGIVCLADVSTRFRTAMLWYVLGDKRFGGRGYTSRAVSEILELAFTELGLEAVNAWALEENTASIRVLERNNFRLIGRQRQCHYIDGRACDRLLFDLLATEHRVL